MKQDKSTYRIVKYYNTFFSKWCYSLEKRETWRRWWFGWQHFESWKYAGSCHGELADSLEWKEIYGIKDILTIRDHNPNQEYIETNRIK